MDCVVKRSRASTDEAPDNGMSDVIWAAGIAGAVGIAGNIAQYFGVKKQAGVELAKVNAENERLRQQVRETERANRQDTYNRLLSVLSRMDFFATGGHPDTDEEYRVARDELNTLMGAVRLLGADDVNEALDGLRVFLKALGRDIDERQRVDNETFGVAFGAAWRRQRRQYVSAENNLIQAMRDDVIRPSLRGVLTLDLWSRLTADGAAWAAKPYST
jgi:hypothetical protein